YASSDLVESQTFKIAEQDHFAISGRQLSEIVGHDGGPLTARGLNAGGAGRAGQGRLKMSRRLADGSQVPIQGDVPAGVSFLGNHLPLNKLSHVVYEDFLQPGHKLRFGAAAKLVEIPAGVQEGLLN